MTLSASPKLGRNDPCPCGSGKKYKVCCASIATHIAVSPLEQIQSLQQAAQQAVTHADFAKAEQCYRQLHILKPKDAYIQASLGQALCWIHRRREGLRYLLEAAKAVERQTAKSKDPKFAIDLSSQLLHWGEIRVAERLARLAVALAPNSVTALNNLVLCLTRVNRNVEALPLSRRVCELLPNQPGCTILLAIIESQLGHTEPALSRLHHVIERNDAPDQTARAWLELGVMLDKLGQYDEAFAALTNAANAHTALLTRHPVNREYVFHTLRRNRQGFDSALLSKWHANVLVDDGLPTPAFLMGFLRSGTTLTERVLEAHPNLLTTDESSIVFELTQKLQAISGMVDDHASALRSLDKQQIKQLRQFYWQRMREEYGGQVMRKQVVDKNALNTIDLGVISVVFPEAKILFALRDPRDISISCFMQAFTLSPATVNLLSWEGIAKQYAAVMDFWLALRSMMQPTYFELRYEDTIVDFEASYRRVFEFLGVAWFPGVSKFHERAKGSYISTPSFAAVSQPIYHKAVARWKHYERQLLPILPLLERFIATFGYERSTI